MEHEYILSFSSFYKAAYAKDVLEEYGLHSILQKLPLQLVYSCSTGLYLSVGSIEQVRRILDEKQITARGVYEIVRIGNAKTYRRV